jgi:ATP-dependent exoDNAse (exonuclease V) beta subunit
MALLLRKVRGNEYWLKALTSAGIPIAVGSGGLFWEDPRTRELVAFLKWWDNPANSLSGAVFLRAPWAGVSDQDLDRWQASDPTWLEPFFESAHPLARALTAYRDRVVRPGELLMSLLIADKSENELGATLLGLWHRVEDLSSRGLDFRAVVNELSLATEERRREREVPPPRNRGQLSVLTMHGSKGLEFPHVILVDLGKKGRAHNSPTLFWDRNNGAYLVRKDAEGERVEDPEFEQWKSEERAKELAESKRVFYVALTRAQERLILVCPELAEKDAKFDPETVYDADFWRGWIEASGALKSVAAVQAPAQSAKNPADTREARPELRRLPADRFPVSRPRHSVTEWNLLSRCPRAYEWTYIRPRLGETQAREPLEWLLSNAPDKGDESELTQRELGTEVHACLESGDYERLEELERKAGSHRFRADRVRNWAANSPYMSAQKAWTELPFEIPVEGEILVGSMDRVVETRAGFTVVDFKVTRFEKSASALLDAYQAQMELYRWALGKLTKSASVGAVLVNFSDSDIQEVAVDQEAGTNRVDVVTLAKLASRIVRGEAGVPRPSSLCDVCQFANQCDARKLTKK